MPLGLEHGVDDQVDIVVVEPLGFAQNSFLNKAEAFGDGAAFHVADGTMQDDTIAALIVEGVIGETGSGSCDDAAAPVLGIQPVADLGFPVQRVDMMLSEDAGKNALTDDAERETVVVGGLRY